MQSDRDARIRERAYQIWVAEGRVDGKQEEHWHRAEREIADADAPLQPAKKLRKPSAAKPARAPVTSAAQPKTVSRSREKDEAAAKAKEAETPAPRAARSTAAKAAASAAPKRSRKAPVA